MLLGIEPACFIIQSECFVCLERPKLSAHSVPAMTRKKTGGGLGNSLVNDRRKRDGQQAGYNASGVAESQAKKSVLEQSSLDDFIAKAEPRGINHVLQRE